MTWLANKELLITGGTGTLGNYLSRHILVEYPDINGLRLLSRDEDKQFHMANALKAEDLPHKYAFLIGDVRDERRLELAFHGVDYVIHAAAMKQIPIAETNPIEAVKTNVQGSLNVLNAALSAGVSKCMLISSDKAVHPVNLYGATKLVAERAFVQGNVYSGSRTRFMVCRYGNVIGSRGSFIPEMIKKVRAGQNLAITDIRMTRFWIKPEAAIRFILKCLMIADGGEIFIPKMTSCYLVDMAKAIGATKILQTGTRPGEKIHELLISEEESQYVHDCVDHWKIVPEKTGHNPFILGSDNNPGMIRGAQIKELLS